MRLIDKTAGFIGKAVDKTTSAASNAASKAAKKVKIKADKLAYGAQDGDNFPFKLILRQRPNTKRDTYEVFDESENVIYKAKAGFFKPAWTVEVTDPYGLVLAKLKKRIIAVRSPLKRYNGENIEFDIELNWKKIGKLKNKELGSRLDNISKQMKDFKDQLLHSRYEYDFIDMEISNKGFRGYEISTKKGDVLARSKQSLWSYGDCYTIFHASKEDEVLYLIMMIAMDFIQEQEFKKMQKDAGQLN